MVARNVRRKRYQPSVGRDFIIEEIEANERYETSRTRNHLARTFLWCGIAALCVAGAVSAMLGSFSPLASVWAVVGPLAGGLATYYFYRDPKG